MYETSDVFQNIVNKYTKLNFPIYGTTQQRVVDAWFILRANGDAYRMGYDVVYFATKQEAENYVLCLNRTPNLLQPGYSIHRRLCICSN